MSTRGFFNPLTGFNIQFSDPTREQALRERILAAQEQQGQRSERMASAKNQSDERIAQNRNATLEGISDNETSGRLVQAVLSGQVSLDNAKTMAATQRYQADKIVEAAKLREAAQSGKITPAMQAAYRKRQAEWETAKKQYESAKALSEQINGTIDEVRKEMSATDPNPKRQLINKAMEYLSPFSTWNLAAKKFGIPAMKFSEESPKFTPERAQKRLAEAWSEIEKATKGRKDIALDPKTMTAKPVLEDPGEFNPTGVLAEIGNVASGRVGSDESRGGLRSMVDEDASLQDDPDVETGASSLGRIMMIGDQPFRIGEDVAPLSRGDARRFGVPLGK